MARTHKSTSKLLSLALRHNPGVLGITLDSSGYASVDSVLQGLSAEGHGLTYEELLTLVESNDKQRFALSEDGSMIRASQGHSLKVDLGYSPTTPPDILFHGTADRFVESIRVKGLLRGTRQHVHLSESSGTAYIVGARHGSATVLRVFSGEMDKAGLVFWLSANGVWLTDHVPSQYLEIVQTKC